MTPNQLRLILADALEGAAERLRAHLEPDIETGENQPPTKTVLPLPEITANVLNAEEVARLLGLSRGTVYEAMRTGEIPSLRVGRRLLVPTHALRAWLAASA
jgi:excisionase family DNA binding protein